MYHITCEGIGHGIHRLDIFSNDKLDAVGVAVMNESIFQDAFCTIVGYEYLPFDLSREFSIAFNWDYYEHSVEIIEFSEYDSSDVERIKDYRSRYMNANLLMGSEELLSKVKREIALQEIAERVYIYSISECANMRAVLRRKMSLRDIARKKERMFGGDLVLLDMEVVACEMDRDMEVIVNSLPTEEHIIGGEEEEVFFEQLFAVIGFLPRQRVEVVIEYE
jgi:hypothetical protein